MTSNNKKITFICIALACAFVVPSGCSPIRTENVVYSDYGSRLMSKYQVKRAEKDFYSKIRVTSNLAQSHYRLGIFYLRQGQYSDAAAAFSKAIKIDPNNIKAYNGLAVSYDGMSMYKAAQRVYGAAIARRPDQAYLYNNSGCSHLLQKKTTLALTSFTKARQLDQENNRIRNNRDLVFAKIKRSPVRIIPGAESAKDISSKVAKKHALKMQKGVSCLEEKKRFAVEVSNGNGVRGMAGKSARYFRKKGITVKHITNAKHFKFQQSVVLYKEGFLREAYLMAAMIPGFQKMKKISSSNRQRVDVKVILGRDTVNSGFVDMIGTEKKSVTPKRKVAQLVRKISSTVGLN
ncbi:MAG: tetratricopeptide repeat protein [Desulfobulbaceae bacterium]|nr:tetratricopeptide repeat protein [Desulfobulbaceae bacterium]